MRQNRDKYCDIFTAGTNGTKRTFSDSRATCKILRAHLDHAAIRKLRMNEPLTAADLDELERMLARSGAGGAADLTRAKAQKVGS